MSFRNLIELMNTLRGERGCPWDRKQTLDSLKPFLIEEAYEVIEAIERKDPEKLKEELGDLLFHIVFLSKVSDDMGAFGIENVIEFVHDKMRRRHPHVFGRETARGVTQRKVGCKGPASGERRRGASQQAIREESCEGSAADPEEILQQWYEMKREERAKDGSTSLMDNIPPKLPALQKAQKVQRRAAEVGFDWKEPGGVVEKVAEELEELREAISQGKKENVSEEIGDILFSVVNMCRFLEVDAEGALRGTVAKFMERFRAMEEWAEGERTSLSELSLEEMDSLWERIKSERRGHLGGRE